MLLVAAGAEEVGLGAPVELAAHGAKFGLLVLLLLFHVELLNSVWVV